MQEITTDYGRIKELNLSIKKSLLKSNISNEDILYMRSQVDELISLTCQCDAKSYIFLGKINILEHKYDEAKKCYEKARHLNTKLPSIYYGLFKANVYLENYEEALDNILIFGDLTSASIQIYVYLLQALLDYKNEPIDQPKDLLGQSHLYNPILQNYYLVIQNLNLKQFTKALKHLNICIKLIQKRNYHIDLSYLELLISKVNNKVNLEQKKETTKALKKKLLSTKNIGEYYLLLRKLHELEPSNGNALIFLIEVCLKFQNYDLALKYVKEGLANYSDNKRLLYYLKYIEENNSDDLNYYIDIYQKKNQIQALLDSGKIDEAISLCYQYYHLTHDMSFIYMVGVILFKQELYPEAKALFEQYLASGCYTYLKNCYYYLFYVNYYLKNDIYIKYASLAYELSALIDNKISIDKFINQLLSIKDIDGNIGYMVDGFIVSKQYQKRLHSDII